MSIEKYVSVDVKMFEFKKYISKKLWISFYNQINEIISLEPGSILEIGVGTGTVGMILKDLIHLDYESMDIEKGLNPDHVGSVIDMPFIDKKYDVVACFQVLEHLPYEKFEKALSEMFRVAKKSVIISLPNIGKVSRLHIPRICKMKLINVPFAKIAKHEFDGKHYWEMNTKGYEQKKVMQKMNDISNKYHFKLTKEYREWFNPYHHFFVFTIK